MNKRSAVLLIIWSLVIGFMLTFASLFYNHISQKQHCSDSSDIHNVLQCNLHPSDRGIPLAYVASDTPDDGFQAGNFVQDVFVWSVFSALMIYGFNKVRQ